MFRVNTVNTAWAKINCNYYSLEYCCLCVCVCVRVRVCVFVCVTYLMPYRLYPVFIPGRAYRNTGILA